MTTLPKLAERARRGTPEIEAMALAIMRARRRFGWTFYKRERVMAIDLVMAEDAAEALRTFAENAS
jgi:hypothetical protein